MEEHIFLKYIDELLDEEIPLSDRTELAARAYERLFSNRPLTFDGLTLQSTQRCLDNWKKEIIRERDYEEEILENWDELESEYGPGSTEKYHIYLSTPLEDCAWQKISSFHSFDLDALRPEIREEEIENWLDEIIWLQEEDLDRNLNAESNKDVSRAEEVKTTANLDAHIEKSWQDSTRSDYPSTFTDSYDFLTSLHESEADYVERAYDNLFGSRMFSFDGLSPETVERELKLWRAETEVELDRDRYFANTTEEQDFADFMDQRDGNNTYDQAESRAWDALYSDRLLDLDELRPEVRKHEIGRLQEETTRLYKADRENFKPMDPTEYRIQAQSILAQFEQVTGGINSEIQHKEFDKASHTLPHYLEVYKESHPDRPNPDLMDQLRWNFNTRDDVEIDSDDCLDEHDVGPPDDFLRILFGGESTVILFGTHDRNIESLYESWALQAFDPHLIKEQNDLDYPTQNIEESHTSQSKEDAGEIPKPFHSEHPEQNRNRDDDDKHHNR